MKKLGIYTRSFSGHNLEYFMHAVSAFVDTGIDLVFFLPEGTEQLEVLSEIQAPVDVIYHQGQSPADSPLKQSYDECRAILYCLKQHKVDYLIAPTGSYAPYLWPIFSVKIGVPAYFLMTSTGLESPVVGSKLRLVKMLKKRLLSLNKTRSLVTIDNVGYANLEHKHPGLFNKFTLIPDPIAIPIYESQSAGLPVRTYDAEFRVLLYGAISSHPRKNVATLIDAVTGIQEQPDGLLIKLVLAGALSEGIRNKIAALTPQQASKLIVVDRFLTEQEIIEYTNDCDLVCTPYNDHYSPSGVVLRSMHLNCPVLVPSYHWFEFMVNTFGIGYLLHELTGESIANTLVATAREIREGHFKGASHYPKRYFSVSNFCAHWRRIVLTHADPDYYDFGQCLDDESAC